MTVVKFKAKKSTRDPVPIDRTSGAGRFYLKLVSEIEADLAGRRNLSRISRELILAFAGSATALRYLNNQVILGETSELNLAAYATLASTMLRIGSRLGLERRQLEVESLPEHLRRLRETPLPEVGAVDDSV